MDKRDFWATLPGMLTGSPPLSALTGVYLAVRQDDSSGPRPPTKSLHHRRPFLANPPSVRLPRSPTGHSSQRDVFERRLAVAAWQFPRGRAEAVRLSVTGGAYRWEIEAQNELSKSINAPVGFLKDFFASVDVTVRQRSVEPIDVGLIFGAAEGSNFRLLLKSPGSTGVSRASGTAINDLVVNWTPARRADGSEEQDGGARRCGTHVVLRE
jgi:hypothetical protein